MIGKRFDWKYWVKPSFEQAVKNVIEKHSVALEMLSEPEAEEIQPVEEIVVKKVKKRDKKNPDKKIKVKRKPRNKKKKIKKIKED